MLIRKVKLFYSEHNRYEKTKDKYVYVTKISLQYTIIGFKYQYSTVTVFIGGVPFFAQAEVEHAIIRVASDLLLNHQELRQNVFQLVTRQCRIGLE